MTRVKNPKSLGSRSALVSSGWNESSAEASCAPWQRRIKQAIARPALLAVIAVIAGAGFAPSAQAKSCPGFSADSTTYFSSVRVSGASCARARVLLSRATLRSNRKDARVWSYGRWRWRLRSIDEVSVGVTGRNGKGRISAVLSKS